MREIPLIAVMALADALGIMALAPDGPEQPASVIVRDGERRWEHAKAQMTAEAAGTFDVGEAVATLHVMRDVGNAVLGALGDRRVPDQALMHLTMLFAAVAQGDVGLLAL